MRRLLLALPLALLLGCPTADDDDTGVDDDDTSADDDDTTEEPPGRDGPDYSLTDCPTLEEGTQTFDTALGERTVRIDLPQDPTGAPVVFVFHGLGGNVDMFMQRLGFNDLADDEGAIVIAPHSSGLQYVWAFNAEPTDNIDLQLFEDVLACAWRTWDVDLDRVYSTGMSAGGLWTSYLLMHEAQWLAAVAPMSGGVNEARYAQPARPLPALLTWGGPTDVASGLNFDEANMTLSGLLQDDGHFVAECVHDSGHEPPDGAKDYIWTFFEDHPFDVEPEPYADALPNSFPSFCALP